MTPRAIFAAMMLGTVAQLGAAPLGTGDREALLERIEALRKEAESQQRGRFGVARTAFRNAMASDDAAIELYLNCMEKVEYADEQKKTQEFRDWKRAEKDRLADPGLALALRHQLRWLALTLDAAEAGADRTALTAEARKAVAAVFADAEKLKGHHSLLRASVLESVFAKGYMVKDIDLKDWPLSPVGLSEVYSQLVLPPLRKPEKVVELRAAWTSWIEQAGIAAEHWSGNKRVEAEGVTRALALERFRLDGYPEMLWAMEEDLFKAGDQQAAALQMIGQLERLRNHRRAVDWARRLEMLLRGGAEVPAALEFEKASPAG